MKKRPEDLNFLKTLSKDNPTNLALLDELEEFKKYDPETFISHIKKIYGILTDPKRENETIKFITAKDIKSLTRRLARAAEMETAAGTGRYFTGNYQDDSQTKRELEEESRNLQAELEKSKRELERIQREAIAYANTLSKGGSIRDKDLLRMMAEIKNKSKEFKTTEGGYKIFKNEFDAFLSLFNEKYGDFERTEQEKEDAAYKRSELNKREEGENIRQAGKQSDKVYSEKQKAARRLEQIRNMDFDTANLKTILNACNDVAKMQLPIKGVFNEALKTGLLASRLYRYLQRLKGTSAQKFKDFYKDIALGFIEMVKNVVENYKDASKLMKKEDLLNAVRFIEQRFDDEFEEYISGYKEGDLIKKAEQAWSGKQTVVRYTIQMKAQDLIKRNKRRKTRNYRKRSYKRNK